MIKYILNQKIICHIQDSFLYLPKEWNVQAK